ncbi:MAG: flagellar protein FliO/FliZ [Paraglaciecola sp.]|jgi:flagellar protein FliO/FliZ
MLLVNWNVSKSSGSQTPLKSRAWLCLGPVFYSSFATSAEATSLSNPTSIVSIFLSLLLVIAIVFALAYLMRRFNVTHSGSSQLKVVASMMAGTRERVLVIDVGGEQHLLGITSHNINHLAKLDNPLPSEKNTSGENFKDKLAQFMAGKLQKDEPGQNTLTQTSSKRKGVEHD